MEYLKALENSGLNPNFWCSEEYFKKALWSEVINDKGVIRIVDDEGFQMLPAITANGTFVRGECWSDFNGFVNPSEEYDKEFLDYEYLYDAKTFQEMHGGNWSVFRKNSRKWANRIGLEWSYRNIPKGYPTDQLELLLINWLQNNPDSVIQDSAVLLSYVQNGENRKGLFTSDGELRALNIWDSNWRYINFRFCICNPEPFLSEFARLLFYQDMFANFGNCIINDGGVLDRISLKQFKDHLNPISVRKVYTWVEK